METRIKSNDEMMSLEHHFKNNPIDRATDLVV
jgi:hypothetical protein